MRSQESTYARNLKDPHQDIPKADIIVIADGHRDEVGSADKSTGSVHSA